MVYSIDHREDIKEISVSEEKEEEIRESYNRMKDMKATLPTGEEHKAVELEPKEKINYNSISLYQENVFNHIASSMSSEKKNAKVRDELNDETINAYAFEDTILLTSDGMPEYETFRDYFIFIEHSLNTGLQPKYTRTEKAKNIMKEYLG